MAIIERAENPKEAEGWRQGRPLEDPEKTKRWGLVTAKPSEYLVHVRGGRVLKSSGQGASCFKWPWDAVAVVPTSLQRLAFVADQVTAERIGVEVRGVAVYRIANPELAFRVLNFSYPERAQQKLAETLSDMLVGATRRLVANLSVDECLSQRKQALAARLLEEVAPVVGGSGRPDDRATAGWGVVLDTLEIQEVRVLSQQVFAAMQAPYRAALERRAEEARAQAQTERALREAEERRSVETARMDAEQALLDRRRELQRSTLEAQHAEQRARADAERETALLKARAEQEVEEARLQLSAALERRRAALADEEAEARALEAIAALRRDHRHARTWLEVAEDLEAGAEREARRARFRTALDVERRHALCEAEAREQALRLEEAAGMARVKETEARAEARRLTAERLPALAAAVGQRFGEVKVVSLGEGNAFGSIAQALGAVLELARDD